MEFQKENKYYVYAISDPVNKTPFYVGKGSGKRAFVHLKCKESNVDKNKIIKLLQSIGINPRIDFIAENLDEKTAYEIETIIIKNAINYGINLTNKVGLRTPPSRKGKKLSEETKRKISLSLKGKSRNKPFTDEHRNNISKSKKGKVGPNKRTIEDLKKLSTLYIEENYTKKQICDYFNVGMGSLNRILNENNIKKTKNNFISYAKSKNYLRKL